MYQMNSELQANPKNFQSLKDVGTLLLAAIGAVLGVYNTVRAHCRDRAKLKVTPHVYRDHETRTIMSDMAVEPGEKWDGFCIEVVNTGFVSVTLDEVGFLQLASNNKLVANMPSRDGRKLPVVLKPGDAYWGYGPADYLGLTRFNPHIRCAFAKAAGGKRFTGSSKALESLLRKKL
jgi:hypothetical protein